jgi:hypothetical protein
MFCFSTAKQSVLERARHCCQLARFFPSSLHKRQPWPALGFLSAQARCVPMHLLDFGCAVFFFVISELMKIVTEAHPGHILELSDQKDRAFSVLIALKRLFFTRPQGV